MPQALTAFPQQLLSPLNLQPATGVEGLQGGRSAPLNHALFPHNPGGCSREMFDMSADNQDASPQIRLLCVHKKTASPKPCPISFRSDYCSIMCSYVRTRRDEMIIWTWHGDTVQTEGNVLNLFCKVPLKPSCMKRGDYPASTLHHLVN